MKDVKNSILITVSTPKVIPLATEPKHKKIAMLKNGKGESVDLKSHQLTRDLLKFMENSGLSVEYEDAPDGYRGKTEINGVPVKVSPINHTNYDGGAFIKVSEGDDLSLANTVKVLKYLRKNGIDLDKFCRTDEKGTSCIAKLKEVLS